MCQVRAGVPEAANRARRMIVTRYPDRVLHIAGNSLRCLQGPALLVPGAVRGL